MHGNLFPWTPSPSWLLLLPGDHGEQINSQQSAARRPREVAVVTPQAGSPSLQLPVKREQALPGPGAASHHSSCPHPHIIRWARLTDSWFPLPWKEGAELMTSTSERSGILWSLEGKINLPPTMYNSHSCTDSTFSPRLGASQPLRRTYVAHSGPWPTSVQLSSVAQSCLTLCNPMNCSMPGLPVHHQLPEFTQTHVHWVGNAIQPSHPLSSPSPPAPNPSQHQRLFQWVNPSHEVAKVLEFQL